MTMTVKQIRFVHEYVIDGNGTQAAIRAGYSEDSAGAIASETLTKPEVSAYLEEHRKNVAAAALCTPAFILEHWMGIVSADPNELVQHRRVNCRHCNGIAHEYQWTEREYIRAVNAAMTAKPLREPPDALGGFDFKIYGAPHPDCPECGGEGVDHVHVADTRHLKGNARKLYNGIEKTKDGIKLKTLDRDAAAQNIATYLGMNKQQVLHLSDNSKPKTLADFYGSPESDT